MKHYRSFVRPSLLPFCFACAIVCGPLSGAAQEHSEKESAPAPTRNTSEVALRLRAASVYLPVYAHIYFGDQPRTFNLAVTISIRNPNPDSGIDIEKVDYHGSNGKLLRSLAPGFKLAPLEAREIKIQESDVEGGMGASVLVRWKSEAPVSPALVESVMIGTAQGQGISFLSRGQIVTASE